MLVILESSSLPQNPTTVFLEVLLVDISTFYSHTSQTPQIWLWSYSRSTNHSSPHSGLIGLLTDTSDSFQTTQIWRWSSL